LLQFLFQERPETQLRGEASLEAVVLPLPLSFLSGDGCMSVGTSVAELLVGLEMQVVTILAL